MKKFLIKVNGNQYEVEVEEVKTAHVRQHAHRVVREEKAAHVSHRKVETTEPKPTSDAAKIQGGASVTAPMPGTILKVNVDVGDVVKKDQVVLVLEAMKMENELVSPIDGKVLAVNVAKGSSATAGEVLLIIQ